MSTITIRDVSPETLARIKGQAKRAGLSMNRFLLRMLSPPEGKFKPREYSDLDHLFGTMDEETYEQLAKEVTAQRRIDEDIWS